MKLRFPLFLFLLAAICDAQTPVPIQVPSIYGNNARFRKAIDLLSTPQLDAQGNWRKANAFSADIGIANISDPAKFDPKVLEDAVYYALTHGATIFVARFHQNIQPIVYQNGKPVYGPDGKVLLTAWGKVNGKAWHQNWRPPETTWKAIGALHTRFAQAMLAGAGRAGRDSKALRIILFNEPCKRGAGGQHFGSFSENAFPAEFVDKPDGYIEPEFWRMARTIRYSSQLFGIRTYAVSFESDKGSTGDIEMAHVTGYDAQRFFEGCSGYALNNYPRAAADPATMARNFDASIQTTFARADANAILANEDWWAIMEANVMESRLTAAQKPLIADYRNAVVDKAAISGLDFVGLFTAYGFAGCNLFNSDWTRIGGVVGSKA